MNRPIEILLVENDPGYVRLTVEALKEGETLYDLTVARDGTEALARLRRRDSFSGHPRPDLILLALELPKRDSLEVLAEIKADPELRAIPVVILAISDDESDVLRAYDHHANCYVAKPLDPAALVILLRTIGEFWLTAAKLPKGQVR